MKSRHLKEFIVEPKSSATGQASRSRGNTLPPPLGVIEFIHVASMGTNVSLQKGVLSVVSMESAREDTQP